MKLTAQEVLSVAATIDDGGRWGKEKVWIRRLYEARPSGRMAFAASMPFSEFQRQLFELHRAGEIELVRVDLTGAVEPEIVAASETRNAIATYHTVRVPPFKPAFEPKLDANSLYGKAASGRAAASKPKKAAKPKAKPQAAPKAAKRSKKKPTKKPAPKKPTKKPTKKPAPKKPAPKKPAPKKPTKKRTAEASVELKRRRETLEALREATEAAAKAQKQLAELQARAEAAEREAREAREALERVTREDRPAADIIRQRPFKKPRRMPRPEGRRPPSRVIRQWLHEAPDGATVEWVRNKDGSYDASVTLSGGVDPTAVLETMADAIPLPAYCRYVQLFPRSEAVNVMATRSKVKDMPPDAIPVFGRWVNAEYPWSSLFSIQSRTQGDPLGWVRLDVMWPAGRR